MSTVNEASIMKPSIKCLLLFPARSAVGRGPNEAPLQITDAVVGLRNIFGTHSPELVQAWESNSHNL